MNLKYGKNIENCKKQFTNPVFYYILKLRFTANFRIAARVYPFPELSPAVRKVA